MRTRFPCKESMRGFLLLLTAICLVSIGVQFIGHGAQGSVALIKQNQLAPEARTPAGAILAFAGANPPDGWLLCDGSAVSRTKYAELFKAVGASNGSGDGSTTFNLPDLRGRVPVGRSSDPEFDVTGKTGGEKAHALTIAEMPAHTHEYTMASGPGNGVHTSSPTANWGTLTTASTGGGAPHNNLQPYQVVNYIIRY